MLLCPLDSTLLYCESNGNTSPLKPRKMINNQQESPIQTPIEKHNFTYLCYRCNKPGHFIKHCPETTPKRSSIFQPPSSSSTTTIINPEFPTTHCRCGAGLCEIRVSNSSSNPGRKYYRCPGKYDKHCGYFKWCDMLREGEIRRSQPEFNFPTCLCGAGVCTVRVEESGPNAGRRYFACPIRKGDGACNFRRWLDDFPKSTLNIPEDAAAEQNILLDEFNLSYEEPMPIDVLELGAHEPPLERVQMRMEGSGRNKRTDRADEPSKEIHSHAAQNNDPQVTLDSEMTNQNMAEDNSAMKNTPESITTVAALRKRSVLSILLFMLTLVLTSYLSTTKCPDPLIDMLQFLRGHVLPRPGSPGQVVDSPQGVTISAMRPVIKGTFPNIVQVTMHEENVFTASGIVEDSSEDGFEASPSLDGQPWSGLLLNPSGLLRDGLHEGSSMSVTILQAFEKLAHQIRDKLITLLDSMDPRDHEIMLKEAGCAFAALDHLQVDYGLFRMRVTEYINQATSLAHVERAINEDTYSEDILRRYNNEKSRYDEIWDAYHDANVAYIASSEKLSALRTNASYFRDTLAEFETQLACYEVDNARHRYSLYQISKTLSECKDSLQAAFREASEVLKLHEKREIERSAAKAAFEKARAQLLK